MLAQKYSIRRRWPARLKTHASTDLPIVVQCSRSWHRAIGADAETFAAETVDHGFQDDGAGGSFPIGNCKACRSTIGGTWASDHDRTAEQCLFCRREAAPGCCPARAELLTAEAGQR